MVINLKMEKKEIQKEKSTFMKFLSYFKGSYAIVFGALILLALVEVLMIVDNIVIKEMVDLGEGFVSGSVLLANAQGIFLTLMIIFAIAILVRSTSRYFHVHLENIFKVRIEQKVKEKYFNKIIGQDYNFHTDNQSGVLISKLSRGSSAASALAGALSQVYRGTISLILVFVTIAYFSLIPALITIFTAVILFFFSHYTFKFQKEKKLIQNEVEDSEKGYVSNIVTNFEAIKFFGRENRIKSSFGKRAKNSHDSQLVVEHYLRRFNWGVSGILGIGTFLLLYFSFTDFLAGNITIGAVVFIFTTFGRMIQPVITLTSQMGQINRNIADLESLFEYDNLVNSVQDKPGAKDVSITRGEINFENISFTYDSKKIFDDFSLNVKPGEKVAIVGESGSGKTSLVRLLFRLYDVQKGAITVDGVDIRDVKQELFRSQMSIVPQDSILFNDTLSNNIKFSRPNASNEQLLSAIKKSALDSFVNGLDKKEQTLVGERGVKLSGGERQRVSIARAMLAQKKIVILDEPTSSLDSKTEKQIQVGMDNLLRGKTSIIIAHRLSTIMNSDRIVVIGNGKIVEEGTHKELLKKKGHYFSLWQLQKGGVIPEQIPE